MGATWLFLYAFQWLWQFGPPGNDFCLGSQKEQLVDRLDDPKSLFWKLKFNIKRQPSYLLPEGFDHKKHINFLRIVNPQTASSITGEANHEDYSRSGRYSANLYDEFAFWKHTDSAAWTAGGDTTKCRFALSTAHGKNNHFYKLRNQDVGSIDVKRLHWKLHPEKDQAWYDNEKTRRSPAEIAAELDIDYAASVTNKAAEMWNPVVHVPMNGMFVYDPQSPLNLTCDFNIDPMCWSVSQDFPGGRTWTFKEYTKRTTITSSVMQDFIRDFSGHASKMVYLYGDRSGHSRNTRSRSTDWSIMKDMLRSGGWQFVDQAFKGNPRHSLRIQSVNKRLSDWEFEGQAFEYVSPKCKKVIESIEQTETKDDGIDKNGMEHHFDAWSYRIAKKYPAKRVDVGSV